jgi:S-adenosylmethionine-diacylgycerolhomoserine-N-methlytransferase
MTDQGSKIDDQRSPFDAMDSMYRVQRYFYDLTRKYYLLGRDRLLNEMNLRPGESILEAGCGTARNLIILARKQPQANLFGLDASTAMLETAALKIDSAGVKNISLETALADDFAFDKTFGLAEPFDKIFFSYSISMIPPWRESIDNALRNLKPGGELCIVDFYDQADLPAPFRRFLRWWLSKFHVQFWPELIPHLRSLEQSGVVSLQIESLFRSYSFIARMKKF